MGLFANLIGRPKRQLARAPRRTPVRRMNVEQMEDRRLMAADVLLGGVYLEDALSGEDNAPDTIRISFVGGAAGTTLDRIVIDGDKVGNGATGGDIFFDTVTGNPSTPGAFGSSPFRVVSSSGFTVTSFEVVDGGTQLVINLEGFEAGEELIFSIDVDEYGETRAGLNWNAVAEGGEFEGSILTGDFSAPGFVDLTLDGVFYDFFDSDFAAAESAAGSQLTKLPGDDYDDPNDPFVPVRTAGAVAHAPQIELARLSGYVYHDKDDDGVFDTGEAPIGGVTLELLGAAGQGMGVYATTNALGYYQFINLTAGTYGVRETQPAGWLDGKDTVGSHHGTAANDLLTGAVLNWGDRAVNYNFGELLPGSIAGRVGANNGPDCKFDNPDLPLAGVTIQLLDANGTLLRTTLTDAEGRYKFENLTPGEYQVRELQPEGYYDGGERVGTEGGVATNDLITDIYIGSDRHGVQYDFCEKIGANLSGYVYHDRSNDGSRDPGEEPIAEVTLKLLNADGTDTGLRAVTDTSGYYQFTNLKAGTYRVVEVHPEGWLDGLDTPGNKGGVANNPGDLISEIVIQYGDDAVEYNFGELLPGSIAGRVGGNYGPDCKFDDPDVFIAGVTIQLLDAQGNVLRTTTTDSLGEYRFDGLAPGEYQVRELQPTGWFDGGERVGTAGGVKSNDLFSQILIGSDVDGVRYDFCEHVGAKLSGFVYHDRDNDGVRDPGEEPIPGVTVKLLRGDGTDTGLRATTNSSGFYQFTGLDAGKYRVMEVHPAGWLDGLDTAGSEGGVPDNPGDMISEVMLDYGDDAVEYNFGELLPASIAGGVYWSPTGDCACDCDNKSPLSGVTVELLNERGLVIATTTTDDAGQYRFDNLPPGVYTVRERQPAGYFDGGEMAGSAGGVVSNDLLSQILLGSGVDAIEYDFCEIPPAALSGYVFVDGAAILSLNGTLPDNIYNLKDGVRDAGDAPIAGVKVQLVHGLTGMPFYRIPAGGSFESVPDGYVGIEVLDGYYPDGVFETYTDAFGYYQFLGLPAGTYAVVQVQPQGFIDSIDTAGTTGGQPVNPPRPGEPPMVVPMGELFGQDVIYSINLNGGQFSRENNFSEITTFRGWLPPVTPPVTPPFIPLDPLLLGRPGPWAPLPITPRPGEDIYGGSSQAIGYTWHLSVVNAGQPRELTFDGARVQFASKSSDDIWKGADRNEAELSKAKWRLLASDGEGVAFSELLFGAEDAVPVAGDWNGDGVTDVGVFFEGDWYLDLDGDGRWSEGDLWAQLGSRDDIPVTGDWDGDGKTDIGIYGPAWPRDPHAIEREPGMPDYANYPGPHETKAKNVPPTDDDATSGARLLAKLRDKIRGRRADVIDHVFHYGAPGDVPVTGDWNGDGVRTIGVFRDGQWTLDANGDGRFDDADRTVLLGQAGDLPLVGDFNGDGVDDLGVYRAGRWLTDANRDGQLEEMELSATDQALAVEVGGKPIVGDWDGDGVDEPALVSPVDNAEAGELRVSQRKAG